MRDFVRVLFTAPALVALIASFAQCATATPISQSRSADDWYEQAVEAAVAGDETAREEALEAAVEVDPDHAPSRGERGEVEVDGRWVSARYAQQLAADNPERDEYGERLKNVEDTPTAHARMAKWCEKAGLRPEARAHWLKVLQSNPKNADALEGINATWRGDKLVDRGLAEEADEEDAEAQRAAQAWEKRLRQVERSRGDSAVATFQEEADQHAALPVERRVAMLGSDDEKLDARRRQIAEAFIEASYDLPSADVTASLCRIATLAADKEIADLAREALRRREKFDVMPLLLSNLKAPLEVSHNTAPLDTGGIVYGHRVYEQGQEVDQELIKQHAVHVSMRGINALPRIDQRLDALMDARVHLLSNQLAFVRDSKTLASQVEAYNQVVADANERVFDSLQEVTDKDLGSHPRQWWDYWQRYSGYDVPYLRPVSSQSTATQSGTPPPPPVRHECFVAGTPVWTRDGKRAIETLKAGDLVMSRDPYRGGIVYRVVTATTAREPSPMVEVVAGGESIHATVGHPFWVLGRGWRMAKELAEGDVLSTLYGPVTVTAVNDYQNAAAYNLVVEDAANYYVGDNGVLVHDNTPRVPAVGLVARR